MRLRQHSLALVVVFASTCLIQIHANRKPEWKEGAGALSGDPFISQIEGTEIKLSCPAKGRPKPELIWYKDDTAFFPRSDKIRMKGSNLKFMDLKVTDQGNYTCVAQNTEGFIEFTFVVEVMEKIWPLEANVSSNMTVREGEDAEFFCIVTNDVTAKIQWLKIDRDESTGDRPQHTFLQSADESPEVLILHDVVPADAGQYMCLIGNKFGSKYLHMYLTVIERTTSTTSTTTTTPTTTTTTTSTTSTTTSTTTTTTSTTTTPTTTTTMTPTTTTERITEKPDKKKKDKKKKDKKRKDKKKKDKKKDKKKKKDRQREKEKDKMKYEDPFNNNELDYSESGYDTFPFDKDDFDQNTDFDSYDFNTKIYNDYTEEYEPVDSRNKDIDIYMTKKDQDTNKFYDDDSNFSSVSKNETGNETAATSGGISVYTVYIIVGAVAGGILLAGLVAIAIALCCQREEDPQYKSTSV